MVGRGDRPDDADLGIITGQPGQPVKLVGLEAGQHMMAAGKEYIERHGLISIAPVDTASSSGGLLGGVNVTGHRRTVFMCLA